MVCKQHKLFGFLLFFVLFLASCAKDPQPPNDEELITTIDIVFTEGGNSKHWIYRDIDGTGGAAAVITADTLAANTTYNLSIHIYNESVFPADTISKEVEEEGDEHQFFYTVPTALANIVYADTDINGYPIGLQGICTTGNADNGTFTLVLRHMPNKTAANVSAGDITNAGGETDIEVVFDCVVE